MSLVVAIACVAGLMRGLKRQQRRRESKKYKNTENHQHLAFDVLSSCFEDDRKEKMEDVKRLERIGFVFFPPRFTFEGLWVKLPCCLR